MAELLQSHRLKFTASDTEDVDTTLVTAGAASTQTLVNTIVVQNNDSESQTITVKLKDVGSTVDFTKTYTIATTESEILVEFSGAVLDGGSNPDLITISFGTAMTDSDTLDCIASSVLFS